jgi:N-acetylneuraminate lyase
MSRFEFWAAALTPYDGDGRLDVSRVPEQVDHLVASGIAGVFVNGTSGEFPALTVDERIALLEAWTAARTDGLRIGVQVGGVPLATARELAEHAEAHGVDLIGSVAPFYGEAPSVAHAAGWIADVANAAPVTPFGYYQIPSMTGSTHAPSAILIHAAQEAPTVTAVKFTDENLMELDAIMEARPDVRVYFGRDELLPAALALGLGAGIGSLFNGLGPVAHAVVDAFDRGDVAGAYALHRPFRQIARASTGPGFVKELMNRLGPDVGPTRPVWGPLDAAGRAVIDELVPRLRDAVAHAKELTA